MVDHWAAAAYFILFVVSAIDIVQSSSDDDDETNPCQLYIAQSTIPGGKRMYVCSHYVSNYYHISKYLNTYIMVATPPHHNKQTNKTKQNTAGLGVFAGTSFKYGEQLGRVGDAAFPTVDHDWHNSPESGSLSKHEADYHWPLTNYDWNAPDIGMENEAEDVSVTVIGFGGKIIIYVNCFDLLMDIYDMFYFFIVLTYENKNLNFSYDIIFIPTSH